MGIEEDIRINYRFLCNIEKRLKDVEETVNAILKMAEASKEHEDLCKATINKGMDSKIEPRNYKKGRNPREKEVV